MNPNKILSGLQKLQKKLQSVNKQENEELLLKTVNENLWFVEANVLSSIEGISSMLITADLQKAIDQFYSEKGCWADKSQCARVCLRIEWHLRHKITREKASLRERGAEQIWTLHQ